MAHFLQLLAGAIPNDHSRQHSARQCVKRVLENASVRNVLDLGCADGESLEFFRSMDRSIRWTGLDIGPSAEIPDLPEGRGMILRYDGIRFPIGDESFDLVYCRQVLEHVEFPEIVLREVSRILRPAGLLVGSTSQLEPYHAKSVWNYTPYGFRIMLERAGLTPIEIRPGIDSITLIARRVLGCPQFFSHWFERESPLNRLIGWAGWLARKPPAWINACKLMLCGQFAFVAKKGGTELVNTSD